MKHIYKTGILLVLFILVFTNLAGADGWWPWPWPIIISDAPKLIYSPNQKAVIAWNPNTNKEIMLLSTTAKTDTLADLWWIIPINSTTEPIVEDCEFKIFWDLAQLHAPKKLLTWYPWLSGFYNSYGASGALPAESGVTVVVTKELDIYDIIVVFVTNSQDFVVWLEENNFFVPEGAEEVIQTYTQDGSYFIINKVDLTNEHLVELNLLKQSVFDLYEDFMDGTITEIELVDQIASDIHQDVKDNKPYSESIAQDFIGMDDYVDNLILIKQTVKEKLYELINTVSELKEGVATPLKIEFTPPEKKATFPLRLTSLAPGDTHIEVYVIAPYKVNDSSNILKHEKQISQSSVMPGLGGISSYSSQDSYRNPYPYPYPYTTSGKVFIELSSTLINKITTEYGISLPEGSLWSTRLVYKGKAEDLNKDALFELYREKAQSSPSPSPSPTSKTCGYMGCWPIPNPTSSLCIPQTFGICSPLPQTTSLICSTTSSFCGQTSGICVSTSGVCGSTSAFCGTTFGFCGSTSGICSFTSSVCGSQTSGICDITSRIGGSFTFGICGSTQGMCISQTSGICSPTSGFCTQTFGICGPLISGTGGFTSGIFGSLTSGICGQTSGFCLSITSDIACSRNLGFTNTFNSFILTNEPAAPPAL